jgi:hypothetical protein
MAAVAATTVELAAVVVVITVVVAEQRPTRRAEAEQRHMETLVGVVLTVVAMAVLAEFLGLTLTPAGPALSRPVLQAFASITKDSSDSNAPQLLVSYRVK